MSEAVMDAAPIAFYKLMPRAVVASAMPSSARFRPAHAVSFKGGPGCEDAVVLTPSPHHIWLAGVRLRIGLLQWAAQGQDGIRKDGEIPSDIAMLVADQSTRARLGCALSKAAIALSLPNVDAVSARLDRLTLDFAPLEALRERLFDKAKALIRLLMALRRDELGLETLVRQCGLMLISAVSKMQIRLHEADTCATDVVGALRDIASVPSLLHSCSVSIGGDQTGWVQMLALWDNPKFEQSLPDMLSRTHAFLITTVMRHRTERP